jgi:phage baseplate assembly protein gpV
VPQVTVKAPQVTVKAPQVTVKAPQVTVKAHQDPKEVAEQAAWDKEYEEISLGGNTYLRHRQLGLILVKGGVRELGDQMPEWDEDLGEFMAE